jgi:hypothetical protein
LSIHPVRCFALIGLLGVQLALLARPARAQTGEGFLFATPVGTVSIRAGLSRPAGKSEIFSFVKQQLTLDAGRFRALDIGFDVGLFHSPRILWTLGASIAGRGAESEFRDYVGEDDLPIVQTTRLVRVPITAGVRLNLLSPGQAVGTMAWIPSKVVPYLGVGAGLMIYSFTQEGEFVDFETLDIYEDRFESSGTAPVAQASAGLDISVTPRFGLTTEGRYSWASAKMNRDFVGFDRIDLSGLSVTAGISVRF